jgi:hypothetical protein
MSLPKVDSVRDGALRRPAPRNSGAMTRGGVRMSRVVRFRPLDAGGAVAARQPYLFAMGATWGQGTGVSHDSIPPTISRAGPS